MKPIRIVSIALLLAAAGCTPREEVAPSYATPTYAPQGTSGLPPERSYLDPGPAPSRGGPNYLRENAASPPRQTDMFGNDVVPRIP
jgi:hypothetical protein